MSFLGSSDDQIIRWSLVSVLLLVLVSCSSSDPTTSITENDDACLVTSDCSATIELWHGFSGNLREQFEIQVAEFNASQGNYVVNGVYKGTYADTLQAGIDAYKAGNGPALLQVYEVGAASIAAESISISVPDLSRESGVPIDSNRYFSVIANFYSGADNILLAAPYNASSPVLFLNTSILAAAGIEAGASTRTWQEMEALLLSLRDRGQSCSFTTAWQSWIQLENLSAYHDKSFSTFGNGIDGLTSDLTIATDFHVSHINLLAEWVEQGIFTYKGRLSQAVSSFLDEECALLTTSSANFRDVVVSGGFPFEVRPLPYYDIAGAPNNTIIGGAAFWTLKDRSLNEYKAAAAFINFVSADEQQVKWHEATGYLPLSESAYREAIGQGVYARQPGLEVAVQQMLGRDPTTNSRGVRLGNFVEIRDIINTELENVWDGDKTATQALQDATERGNLLLRQFEDEFSNQ